MRALLTIGYYALIITAVTLGAFLVALQFDLLPGYELRIVQSGSMEPALPVGSVVLIQPAERYVEGDIVTFGDDQNGSLPTTHRIIGDSLIGGELAYITKGDANEESDVEPVLQDDIRGKVRFDIPYLGFLLDFARQPLGFALLIGIPALMIIVEEVTNLYQAIRGNRRKEDEDEDNEADVTPSENANDSEDSIKS